MKKFILLLAIIFIVNCAWSQNPNLDFKHAIKIQNLTSFQERVYNPSSFSNTNEIHTATVSTLRILQPTIAFQWQNNKSNFHEVELIDFSLEKRNTDYEIYEIGTNNSQKFNGSEVVTSSISVRYEYIVTFNKEMEKKLVPSLGFGFNPFFMNSKFLPETTTEFSSSDVFLGARFHLIPRINYFFSSKVFLNLNIPIEIAESYFVSGTNNNPALMEEQRTTNSFNSDQFSMRLSGRVGMGIKL